MKKWPPNAGGIREVGSIPGWGSSPGGGHGNPLRYSRLANPTEEEPGGLQSMGQKESDMAEATEHRRMPQPESSVLKIRVTVYSLIPKSFSSIYVSNPLT